MHSCLFLHCKPCFCNRFVPQSPWGGLATSIQTLTPNASSHPCSALWMLILPFPAISLQVSSPANPLSSSTTSGPTGPWDILYACIHYLPSAGCGEPEIYSLIVPSNLFYSSGPKHKIPLPFSVLFKPSTASGITVFWGLKLKRSPSQCNILLSCLDSSFQCLKGFHSLCDKNSSRLL